MTENEREEILKDIRDGYIDAWDNLTLDELFKQIEKEHKEIQAYRAIGTVEEFKGLKEMLELKDYVEGQEIEPYGRPRVFMGIEELIELNAYRDFGTLPQFRILNERYHELINRPSEQEIRAKAIDEFAEALYNKSTFLKHIESDDYGMLHYEDVYEIAEQMKAGGDNE